MTPLGTREAQAQTLSSKRGTTFNWSEISSKGTTPHAADVLLSAELDLETAEYVTPAVVDCPEYMEMKGSLGFSTSDGAFDEVFVGSLTIDTVEGARFLGGFPADKKKGAYNDDAVTDDYVAPEYLINTSLESGGNGEVAITGDSRAQGKRVGVTLVGTFEELEERREEAGRD